MGLKITEGHFGLRARIDESEMHRDKLDSSTIASEERRAITKGRDLVVLADGTGNSAAKSFKTNVWRLYQALDLTDGAQLAVFGDGVGTSSIKLMRYVGLALGVGVKRNVLNLYKFWCLNYEDGDRLWAFGFSRGAYTVRLLVDLVNHEGLVKCATEEELDRAAIAAYRAYRSKAFRTRLPWVWGARLVRDALVRLRNWATGARQYSEIKAETYNFGRHIIDIHFIGVWDTVAAYGLPLKELTLAFHNWVWPMLFDDRSLPPNVLTARHALSLDDERPTFFPIPWNEVDERALREQDDPSLDPDRLIQVWFAGTHANVGGGYPDDSLSYVPLCWMIGDAALKGLRFKSSTVTNYTAIASPTGRLYDSRAGFGAFYRYQPRDVHDLMGKAIRPLVHYEVITRMARGSDGYAPVSLPHDFDVLPPYGSPVAFDRTAATSLLSDPSVSPEGIQNLPGRPLNYLGDETDALLGNVVALSQPAGGKDRETLVELVQDTVWWRRLCYFVSLFFALLATAYPLIYDRLPGGEITGPGGFVNWASLWAQGFLPAVAAPWLAAIAKNPAAAAGIVFFLFSSLWLSGFLQRRIRDRAREAWRVRDMNLRVIEQRQAALVATIIFVVLFGLAVWLGRNLYLQVVLGCALLSSAIFWVDRSRRDPESNDAARPSFLLSVARRLRLNETAVGCYTFLAEKGVPFIFLLLCAFLFACTVYRALLDGVSAAGKLCEASGMVTVSDDGRPLEKLEKEADFATSSMCHATGLSLVEGRRYRITLKMQDRWFDQSLETDVGGFPSSSYRTRYLGLSLRPLYLGLPLRRWLVSNWFEPVARIGAVGDYEYPLEPASPIPADPFEKCHDAQKLSQADCAEKNGLHATRVLISDIQPKTSGELFIYVNDAVLLWPGLTDFFYRNNSGSATVKVERITADAVIVEE